MRTAVSGTRVVILSRLQAFSLVLEKLLVPTSVMPARLIPDIIVRASFQASNFNFSNS